MNQDLKVSLAFHLGGRRAAPLPPFDSRELRPAALARMHDLAALRYDFPLVLARGAEGGQCLRSLSGVIDELLQGLATGPDADRTRAHVLRLERRIRSRVAQGAGGLLSELWQSEAESPGARGDGALEQSLAHARAALPVDGEVVDCGRGLPARALLHAWRAAHARKAAKARGEIATLVAQLANVLRADFARSNAGRTPERLRAAFGAPHEDLFDFGALSGVLLESAPEPELSEARRQRVRALITTLESQRFYPAAGREGFEFTFDSVAAARDAYRARVPDLLEVANAIGMAELEARGEYDPARHDAFFAELGAADLGPRDLALFPDYLVTANVETLTPADQGALTEVLSSGLPIKVLIQSDDLSADPAAGIGVRSRQLATLAIGLNHVFVLQTVASRLHQDRERIERGLAYAGPTLFSVFSGDPGGHASLPPYLCAAAALESRAFPSLVYDPSAGPDWASRCDLEANPQVERDWPMHAVEYEDADHQRQSEDTEFTLADFLACDDRWSAHFAPAPRAVDAGALEPASAAIAGPTGAERAPFLWMVDGAHELTRVLVDERLIREARRCREAWHSLQELGGIHNSHAARLLARERREAEARALAAMPVGGAPKIAVAEAVSPAAEAAPIPEAAAEPVPGEPYIETVRCSSCNECIQLNSRMFAYNENKQAYISNPDGGTFRELVEAAESCQVSVIHPGKPRNPEEPGLEELLERAAQFR